MNFILKFFLNFWRKYRHADRWKNSADNQKIIRYNGAKNYNGSLSLKQIQKDKPPFVYVENSYFVSQATDKIKFSVQNNFEEIINLKDCDRKNYAVYEVVTDLDGNFKVIEIIDFEKIPIAKRFQIAEYKRNGERQAEKYF